MEEFRILDYDESMLDEMMQLFYDTVHTINARDYRKEQLNGWAPENSDKRFWQERLKKNVCKVAFIKNKMVGFTELVDDGHVDTLYVHKDFQRQKVAANLIEEILLIAGERNYRVLTTEASITAKPFFEAYGFRVTRIKKKLYNGKDFTNYKMTKEL
ncbi:GNAT family N-acetyltransferase [Segetibacter sp.]|jgi:putative acetyltransferase|uniref:GNAT family N-acetyltransferase n=1 Tax=Segetibacter sp. TaxID=2231182 RepID=UPI00260E0111|nr:GNAT family N-acetyltransferase [Segetibacter sp.]MCW3080863.1 acetyltransferase family protein [Segetibacter sp.]